ncbi:hypothetical protein FHY18_004087 [Xanthomonas arboricola]|nr:hypothetical protein [Xanthomonas sp. 3793]
MEPPQAVEKGRGIAGRWSARTRSWVRRGERARPSIDYTNRPRHPKAVFLGSRVAKNATGRVCCTVSLLTPGQGACGAGRACGSIELSSRTLTLTPFSRRGGACSSSSRREQVPAGQTRMCHREMSVRAMTNAWQRFGSDAPPGSPSPSPQPPLRPSPARASGEGVPLHARQQRAGHSLTSRRGGAITALPDYKRLLQSAHSMKEIH